MSRSIEIVGVVEDAVHGSLRYPVHADAVPTDDTSGRGCRRGGWRRWI